MCKFEMLHVNICGNFADRHRLSVFFVALADWVVLVLSPSIAAYVGGAMIIVAFGLLAKDTLGEKKPR